MNQEMVNHPKHYNSHPSGIETVDIAEHLGFNLGNAFKYIFRAGHKFNTVEDLKKAIWYTKRQSERVYKTDQDAISETAVYFSKVIASEENKNKKIVYELMFEYICKGSVLLLDNVISLLEDELAKESRS